MNETNQHAPTTGATIHGLIFDFGGVLWDMRWDLTRELERAHGLRDRAIVETLYAGDTWRQVEVGAGDRERWLLDAHAQLESIAGKTLPPLHQHWREHQHLIAPNIDLIRALRPPYRTAVLSNADSTLPQRLRDIGIHDLFDAIVCSAEVGMAKPEPRVYALAAERLGLPASACAFIDDLESNVEAARAAGMTGVCFRVDRGDRLDEQLRDLGVALETDGLPA
ncbi:MAG: HAD family hydrolase [Dehalococcoidia bacterium]